MRLTKVFGLAAVAAVAAMAFIGAGTASAAHEVVLCSVLPPTPNSLCAAANVLPAGTEILGLAKNPKLEGTITVECEDSIATVKTKESMNEKLGVELTKLEFGKLPTPSLGTGCTGCTGGIHTAPPYQGTILMENEKDYVIHTAGNALLLNCPFGVECKFGSEALTLLIDPDLTQHDAASQVKGDLLLINNTLNRTGGSILCGSTGLWTASYTTTKCHVPAVGQNKDCWIALREHL
jgi:hypothetical protein